MSFNLHKLALTALAILSMADASALVVRTGPPTQPSCVNFTPFVYAGCFKDDSNPRTLLYSSNLDSKTMTVEKCVAFCKGNDYKYAGLEYYGECYCGASVNALQIEEKSCKFPCNGNKTQSCGGGEIISIYQDPTFPVVSTKTISDYMSMGCYSEGPNGRTLGWKQDDVKPATLTVEKCLSSCLNGGYAFAGVEFGRECYCGVVLGNGTVPLQASECSSRCTGDSTQFCGGRSKLNLYVARNLESAEPCEEDGPISSSSSALLTTTSSTLPPFTISDLTSSLSTSSLSTSFLSTSPSSSTEFPSLKSTSSSLTSSSITRIQTPSFSDVLSTPFTTSSTETLSSSTTISSSTEESTSSSTTSSSTGESSFSTTTSSLESSFTSSEVSTSSGVLPNPFSSTTSSTEKLSSSTTVSSSTESSSSSASTSTTESASTSSDIPSSSYVLATPLTSLTMTSSSTIYSSTSSKTPSALTNSPPSTLLFITPTSTSSFPTTTISISPPSVTYLPTTTTIITSKTVEICTSYYTLYPPVPSPTCAYKLGKWCAKPIPEFSDTFTCLKSFASCVTQLSACFSQAGYPELLKCNQFNEYCSQIAGFCDDFCPGKKCTLSSCKQAIPPYGVPTIPTQLSGQVFSSLYTCPPFTLPKPTLTTTPPSKSTTTPAIPTYTNICTQPNNPAKGYESYSPVGGIPLPNLSCNNDYVDYVIGHPFKLYTSPDTYACPSYEQSGNYGPSQGCRDACDEQFKLCNMGYAESYKGYKKSKRGGSDAYLSACQKCENQRNDCFLANRSVSGGQRCGTFNKGY